MLMIIGGVVVGVWILLEKGPSRHHILKIRKIPENTRKLYFTKRLRKLEGGVERSQRPASHIGGAAWPLAAPALCEGTLAHSRSRPFTYFISLKI
jgi:hypothetical protein